MARKKPEQGDEAGQEMIGLAEAAGVLKVSRSTLTRMLSQGRIRGFKVGRQWRFRRGDLDKLSRMAHPSAAAVNIPDVEAALKKLPPVPSGKGFEILDPPQGEYPNTEEEKALDRLFRALVHGAIAAGASDIHIDRTGDASVMRFRIDGVLHEVARLPWAYAAHRALVACCRYYAEISVDEWLVNHLSLFRVRKGDRNYHVRVATMASMYGPIVVMRILAGEYEIPDLERIGMMAGDRERYLRALRAPTGLVLVTGPTGSGKTTILYAGLGQIGSPEIKMYTIEDPIEMALPGMTQIPVNRRGGMTFDRILRALMVHDPDVIMVGCDRFQWGTADSLAVAEGCMQAAITGHLVATTLHAYSAADAICRMLEIGVKPLMLAESLICVVSSRLARRVCSQCGEPDQPPFDLLSQIAERARAGGFALPDQPKFMRGKGCDHCRGTGYRGRIGLFEVMALDHDLYRLIAERSPVKAIQEAAIKKGMTTLVADGLRKAAAGITSLAEAARVTTEW